MKKMAITIRDAQHQWQALVPLDIGHAIVGCLSADPPRIEALPAALERFVTADRCHQLFQPLLPANSSLLGDVNDRRCAVDLKQRLFLSSWDQASHPAAVRRVGDPDSSGETLPYHLHPSWEFSRDFSRWHLPSENSGPTDHDAWAPPALRRRLYGTRMLQFLIQACQPQELEKIGWTGRPLSFSDDEEHRVEMMQLIREVEIRWLQSPAGVDGLSIRQLLLRDHAHVQRDLIDRIEQWIQLDRCPSGVSLDGPDAPLTGPGRQEVILYHCLLMFLTGLLIQCPLPDGAGLPRSTQLLRRTRDTWLKMPTSLLVGRAPNVVIEQERQRQPFRLPADQTLYDCDCPLCRLTQHDERLPQFWELDDLVLLVPFPQFWHGTDANFMLTPQTDSEWDALYGQPPQSWQEIQFAKQLESPSRSSPSFTWCSPPLPLAAASEHLADMLPEELSSGPWKRVFVRPRSEPIAHSERIYSIAAYVGELITDLKEASSSRTLIDELNRQIDNLAESVRCQPELVQPVILRFRESLDQVESLHPSLHDKISDLQSQLQAMACCTIC
jgi:hypothetical protein